MRDRSNTLEHFTEGKFMSRYRFTKETVVQLLGCLLFKENTNNRGHPLPPPLQLLVALRFCAAGTFQVVSEDLVNVSQPTVRHVVNRVSELIAAHVFRSTVKFPATADELRLLSHREVSGANGVR
ncbi:hypothetical protein HPB48_021738 [Haemaphysalis longicornis]|uniref:Nuclease HARBI1 n=1 Tax=Haemaphysalis longicornis TaxID=44386 RepID=A0A9J6FWD6_HAELO|nr:hypothetical protein HPB48_021738 [Haemaphysalis longicornis]